MFDLRKIPRPNVRAVMSCFNCGREGHIARDCRRKPIFKAGVGRDTRYEGSVGRDTRCENGVGRDTNNVNKPPCKGWTRSGNGERELSSNQTAARRAN